MNHYHFWWNSRLTIDRQRDINEWIDSLGPEQRKMIVDIGNDSYDKGVEDGEAPIES